MRKKKTLKKVFFFKNPLKGILNAGAPRTPLKGLYEIKLLFFVGRAAPHTDGDFIK